MRIIGDLDTSSVQPGARGRSLQSVRPRPAGGGGHGHSESAGRESRARGWEDGPGEEFEGSWTRSPISMDHGGWSLSERG